jgi:hypothetical protein
MAGRGYGVGGAFLFRFARLRRRLFRPFRGLSILAIIPTATRL